MNDMPDDANAAASDDRPFIVSARSEPAKKCASQSHEMGQFRNKFNQMTALH